jgi:hypothetical protein
VSDRDMSRKALYNLLRMNWLEDSSLQVEQWQVADYRSFSLEELFGALKHDHIELNERSLQFYIESFNNPEDLADSFLEDSFLVEKQDRIFLAIFELWRRFAQDKPTISIFSDELDHQIYLYDRSNLCSENLRNVLEYLLEVIEDSLSQEEVFTTITNHCANDIEAFLYDFLADQLDQENYLYVSAFVDRIYDAIPYSIPFDFLKVRLISVSDIENANESLMEVIEMLNEEPDFDLSLEILQYLADQAAKQAFLNLSLLLCRSIDTDEDLLALAQIGSVFFDSIHESDKKEKIDQIVNTLKETKSLHYHECLSTFQKLMVAATT